MTTFTHSKNHLTMKTIFIAIDFSACSFDAARYGIELAERMGYKAVLFHVFHSAVSIPDAFSAINTDELKQTAEVEMEKLAETFRCSKDQLIEVLAVEGYVSDMIMQYAGKYKNPLIICGMRGTGRRIQYLFGNTALSLIRNLKYPLLVIPEGCIFKKINKIGFATDILLDTDIHTLDPLLKIGEVFFSKAYFVRVMSNDLNVIEELNYRSERLSEHFKLLNSEYAFIKSDDVTLALLDFIHSNSIDLISLMPRNHSFVERLFIKRESKGILFNSKVPILYLPEISIKDKFKKSTKSEYYL